MSKQTVSKNQASRSDVHDSMPNVYTVPSKESQRPEPANSTTRDNINVDESKGGVKKRKATPAHLTHFHDLKGEHEETKDSSRFTNRKNPGDAKEISHGAAKARNAGPHGNVIHADGTSQASPSKKQVAKIG